MEDMLKELLDTELQAQALVKEAGLKHDKLIRKAHMDAHAEEERFAARIPESQRSHLEKVDERVVQTVAELRGRYDERQRTLRSLAKEREPQAIAAALALITDPDKG